MGVCWWLPGLMAVVSLVAVSYGGIVKGEGEGGDGDGDGEIGN